MRYVDALRAPDRVQAWIEHIRRSVTSPVTLMELCGGQTHALLRYGLVDMLREHVRFIHGPGCPVCVTPAELIDQALALSRRPGVVVATFADMLRVPGSQAEDTLATARGMGGDVRFFYSPLDAVTLAEQEPELHVVWLAIGFETTAPLTAACVLRSAHRELSNFSVLCAHLRVPPALEAIVSSPEHRLDAVLAAGHVCTVMGYHEYEPLAALYRLPIVVAGFEPLDLLQAVATASAAVARGEHTVYNCYRRSVTAAGNAAAQELLRDVFEVRDQAWRGLGVIEHSGLGLRPRWELFDTAKRFNLGHVDTLCPKDSACRSADVLIGRLQPPECSAFAQACTPEHPLGAPMVSGEGACAAYYRYRRVH